MTTVVFYVLLVLVIGTYAYMCLRIAGKRRKITVRCPGCWQPVESCRCQKVAPRGGCPCLRPTDGTWADLGDQWVGLFPPFGGWKAAKYCPHCLGTGRVGGKPGQTIPPGDSNAPTAAQEPTAGHVGDCQTVASYQNTRKQ